MPSLPNSFDQVTKLDRSQFDLWTGLRSALFVVTPITLGFLTGHLEAIFGSLGALFLANTEGQRSMVPSRILLIASFVESVAVGIGTLCAMLGTLVVPLIGLGVFVSLLLRAEPRWAQVGTFTAIGFALGASLPVDSATQAEVRAVLWLVGGLWFLLGITAHRFFFANRKHSIGAIVSQNTAAARPESWTRQDTLAQAVAVGAASAIGFGIALALGLPREFWVVLTIVISVRPTFGLTLSFSSMMIMGNVVGALISVPIILKVSNPYVLLILLLFFATFAFAFRNVNLGLVQIFLVPFIVILLNILYPGEWQFALFRVLDVIIGGIISIVTIYFLGSSNPTRKVSQKSRTI